LTVTVGFIAIVQACCQELLRAWHPHCVVPNIGVLYGVERCSVEARGMRPSHVGRYFGLGGQPEAFDRIPQSRR
jgi:hypothetical protein